MNRPTAEEALRRLEPWSANGTLEAIGADGVHTC